jgi:hypothetical protein
LSDELKEKIEKKKRQQHEAWVRWYRSPKGEAYRQKLKEKRALNDSTPS